MPCVKKLTEESENSAKPKFIHGHMFGAIGIILGGPGKFFCTLLSARLHDGNETIGAWSGDMLAEESHVVRIIREACKIASYIEPSIIALDRYFLTVPALTALMEMEAKAGKALITIVTKAKKNITAYEEPSGKPNHSRGRPLKKGAAVKLQTLFETEKERFHKVSVSMYGNLENVEVLVKDLLWGKGLYRKLRFVLVKRNGTETILVSTDTTLSAENIIEVYAFRFKIESSFREFKQVVAGFASHFWTRSMPRLSRFAKNSHMAEQLEAISNNSQKTAILSAFNATEAFTMLSIIAFGLVQLLSLRFSDDINRSAFRWLRTKRTAVPSEATTVDFLRKTIFQPFYFSHDLPIAHFIKNAQMDAFVVPSNTAV